ncbi:unnamed protein product, partial [Porites lobata]
MDPNNILFDALTVGPTNSGNTQFLVNIRRGPFRCKFDYMVLICPSFVHNKTYDRFVDQDSRIFVIQPFFESTNTLIILDDCTASKVGKSRTGQLGSLRFSARHAGISVWLLTQQITSIAKPFHENVAIFLFYTPLGKTMKAIFKDYAGELSPEQYKELMAALK